ncbi:myosin-3-like isoform X5 [Gossypium australe]|uniref:Myosin-3-like isoform X5 n=1 Tax=Gossypium australe TaxID=47621 RepID=A0A5B6UY64_9ROSI|nr:myosin-3-like isoform X5 [Gossypium australe]
MATNEIEKPDTSISSKHSQSPQDNVPQSAPTPAPAKQVDTSPSSKLAEAKQFILSVAANISSQPLLTYDPNVWGVLTAISNNVRKRPQVLSLPQFYLVEICLRKRVSNEGAEQSLNCDVSVYLKDIRFSSSDCVIRICSVNGTFFNWERLRKNSPELKVQHGDIISFNAPPHDEMLLSRLTQRKVHVQNEKQETKGLGIGAPKGPISLTNFRSLQRSNKQLEDQVLAIDKLRNLNRATVERHENEIKEIKESVTNSYIDQIKEMKILLDVKQKELIEVNRVSAEQKHAIEYLNERFSASMQLCTEANERIMNQKASIADFKGREKREKAVVDLKAVVKKTQSKAQEELQRLSDIALKRDRLLSFACLLGCPSCLGKSSTQVEDLVPKLQVEELEHEIKGLRKHLETEKAAREEAWSKVSALEIEINAAMRDLLQAFYSTTEKISILLAKQQEQ